MTDDERRSGMTGRRDGDNWTVWDKRIRDAIIFAVGIVGVVNELFIISEPRPSSLIFLASLIGVPFVLSADEKRNKRENGDKRDEGATR